MICYIAGVPGVLAGAETSLEKDDVFACFGLLLFFFLASTTAGRPPKLPRAETSSFVLQVVHRAPSGGEQKTTRSRQKQQQGHVSNQFLLTSN